MSHYPFVKSNFEVNEDSELTTRGFITMHEAQLQQEGEEEIKTLFRIVSRLKTLRWGFRDANDSSKVLGHLDVSSATETVLKQIKLFRIFTSLGTNK